MSSVRIVKTPQGQAPLWVRQEWVGLEISLTQPIGNSSTNHEGYEVSIRTALRELRKKSYHAANWFEVNLFTQDGNFKFTKEECKYLP